MRVACSMVALAVGAVLVTNGLQAQEKDVTLKGAILCARCALKEGDKCQTAVKVTEGKKDMVYYFKDKGNAETYHEEVCGGQQKEGTVEGKLAEMDGKKWITPTKVTYAKK